MYNNKQKAIQAFDRYFCEHRRITHNEALEKIFKIRNGIKKIVSQKTLNTNQVEILNALFMTDEIFTGINTFVEQNDEGSLEIFTKESDEQPDSTDIPNLEKEESAVQRRNQQEQGLKILTPYQMLSRLPISLGQLKAGNNSEKLKNVIRQLLHSLYRSNKNLQNNSTKVWSTLSQDGDNFYEQQKQ